MGVIGMGLAKDRVQDKQSIQRRISVITNLFPLRLVVKLR